MNDLWSQDIVAQGLKAPVTILREQAALLGQKTNNIVEADVVQGRAHGAKLRFGFDIVAPALEYRYTLFEIICNVDFYPVEFLSLGDDLLKQVLAYEKIDQELVAQYGRSRMLRADSEATFLVVLEAILKADKTKRVVSALMAQSGA